MPLPKITVKQWKDGKQVARFRDSQGLVRTRVGITKEQWTRAEQIRDLADYGILLQLDQARQGLGSNGAPMPPLKSSRKLRLSTSQGKKVEYGRSSGYADFKSRLGLKPIRDLKGPGGVVGVVDSGGVTRYRRSATHTQGRGYMLDDIRVNYVDDRKSTLGITNSASRVKAKANEKRAPWWGWSPASMAKFRQRAASVFGTGVAERLFDLGLIGVSALAFAKTKYLRRAS